MSGEVTINIDGQVFRRFIKWPEEITDGTPRCFVCGQIDDPQYHEADLCPAMWDDES